jgi:hypothetical protein
MIELYTNEYSGVCNESVVVEGFILDSKFTKYYRHDNYSHLDKDKKQCDLCKMKDGQELYAINILDTSNDNTDRVLILDKKEYKRFSEALPFTLDNTQADLKGTWFHLETNTKLNENSCICYEDIHNKHMLELYGAHRNNADDLEEFINMHVI